MLTACYAVAIAVDILLPVGLALWVRRRWGVGWKHLGAGALVFFLFQLVTRIPAIQVIQYFISDAIEESEALLVGWLAVAAITAGLFEEVGRYVGYRFFLRREKKTFEGGVMFGVGHGGLESALLVGGLAVAGMINAILLPQMDPSSMQLSPEQADQVRAAQQQIASMPAWMPLLGGLERIFAMAIQIALSVVVLQCFVRGSLKWLWLAIAIHGAIDLSAVLGQRYLVALVGDAAGTLALEGLVAIFGALGLAIICKLRPAPAEGLETNRYAR